MRGSLRGWSIRQLDNAFVHHKYLSSHLRNKERVLSSWYSVLKNKLYFCLVHRHGYHSALEVMKVWNSFVENHRNTCSQAVSAGHLTDSDKERFEGEADKALVVGFQRGCSGLPLLMPEKQASEAPRPFLPYFRDPFRGAGRTYCLLTQEYGPGSVGGVGLYIKELAQGLAELGHQVHVITIIGDVSRVDFEEGVWVHRVKPSAVAAERAMTEAGPVPESIWAAAMARLECLLTIERRKPIDAVYSPIWDCEGAAILRSGRFPMVVGLQTTMAFWLESHPEKSGDSQFMRKFARPVMALEKEMFCKAQAVNANSLAVWRDVERVYNVSLEGRAKVIPHGLADRSRLDRRMLETRPGAINVRLLFVGRLEARKGIDVLLTIAPRLLEEFPGLQIDIVGNDRIAAIDGSNYRAGFEAAHGSKSFASRLVFHGEVADDWLRAFYADCDIFVSPSRYESFGLVFVEAMMFGKPVVGCLSGGMPEVIVDGETGLLATPGDAESLKAVLRRLVADPSLREKMGAAGRLRYESLYRREVMVTGVAALLDAVCINTRQDEDGSASL